MTDIEKLFDLQFDARANCFNMSCEDCKYDGAEHCRKYHLADYLIRNGVTFATDNNDGSKKGCVYCQEDAEGYRRMIGAFAITNPFHGTKWLIETAHCKPRNIYFCPMCGRKLAEPPKEVE